MSINRVADAVSSAPANDTWSLPETSGGEEKCWFDKLKDLAKIAATQQSNPFIWNDTSPVLATREPVQQFSTAEKVGFWTVFGGVFLYMCRIIIDVASQSAGLLIMLPPMPDESDLNIT